jgi:hypothetical protein
MPLDYRSSNRVARNGKTYAEWLADYKAGRYVPAHIIDTIEKREHKLPKRAKRKW